MNTAELLVRVPSPSTIAAVNEQINASFDRLAIGGAITGPAYDTFCRERQSVLAAAGVSLAEWHAWCDTQDQGGDLEDREEELNGTDRARWNHD